jgi:S1-C subfamily serine protease
MDTAASSSYQLGGGGGRFGHFGGSRRSQRQKQTEGFSIPISTALSIASQITGGHGSSTTHIGPTAFLGLEFSSNGQQDSGAQIAGAAQGTPAASAGLAQGDEVTSVGGQRVSSSSGIQKALVGYHPGQKVSLAWTDPSGQSRTATVTLASGPAA